MQSHKPMMEKEDFWKAPISHRDQDRESKPDPDQPDPDVIFPTGS
jgi:hypothetical protein